METLSLQKLTSDSKIALLRELGFESDGEWVLDENGEKVVDPYADVAVKLNNCLILPGSTLILDDNPMSIAAYMEEHGDVFG